MGFLSGILGKAAPMIGTALGGPVGGMIGQAVGGGLAMMGENRAQGYDQRAAAAQQQAMRPFGTSGLFGSTVFDMENNNLEFNLSDPRQAAMASAMQGGQQNLNDLNSMDFQGRERSELSRLRNLRQPQIEQAREALRARQLARGRRGLGIGTGSRTGGMFNPQSAALEQAILQTDLSDIGAARQFSQQEQNFLSGQARNAFGTANLVAQPLLNQAQLGVQARGGAAAGIAAGQPFQNQASSTRDFFNTLGAGVSTSLGGLFGGSPQPTVFNSPRYQGDNLTYINPNHGVF